MGNPVYAIDEFPDDDLPWRIEWIGGLGYNTSVPSEPRIDVCLAQLPLGETNPLSARSRSSQTKRTVKSERLTNCTVDGVAGFRRLVAGGPSAGRKFSDSIDRKIGQAREHRAEVVADR